MSLSKIHICNVALAMLGADSIRSFTDANKRARLCDVFFDRARDSLLSRFDWPFARRLKLLQPLDTDDPSPLNMNPYSLPSDCKTPRDLYPRGSKDPWHVMGRVLYCRKTSTDDVYLYYTALVTDTSTFSDTFADLLALRMAILMGPPLTQDKSLVNALNQQYRMEQADVWESEANVGNDYRAYNEDPDNDSFVNPDGWIESTDDGELSQ